VYRSVIFIGTDRFKEIGEAEGHFSLLQKDTFLCFIDLKKAYDGVWMEGLFRKMEQEGVPMKLVKLAIGSIQNNQPLFCH
jgi:hypothetical protein